jgi:mRNA-degrading endonuclease RelE of RelBE toxin-antitoxin system
VRIDYFSLGPRERPVPGFSGGLKTLRGELAGEFRLRLGDCLVLFTLQDGVMRIFGVRHRSEAYR